MTAQATSFDVRDRVRYEDIHDVRSEHWQWFIDAAAPDDGDLILDCGCGYGASTRELLRRCCNSTFVIDLIDESSVQLERAKKELAPVIQAAAPNGESSRSNLLYIHASVGANWAPTRRYDKILLKMVLHEVAENDQLEFLNKLYTLLRPGGVLIVWDLALDPCVAPFFRTAINKKDHILAFETMVNRRHFLTANEFVELVAKSSFKTADTVKLFDCEFHSERRVDCEFKGDTVAYSTWVQFIKDQASSLKPEEKTALQLKESGDSKQKHVNFIVQRAIWRLRKPDSLSILNTLAIIQTVAAHLRPTSAREDLTEEIQKAVFLGIQSLGEHQLLLGHKGLVRMTTFELKDKGRRELSKDGTDYVYCFDQSVKDVESSFVEPLLRAYYFHIAYVYHRKKHQAHNAKSLTDYLNECGKLSPNASWLRITAPIPSENSNTYRIEVTLCIGSETIIHDVLVTDCYSNFKQTLIDTYPIPLGGLGGGGLSGFAAKIELGGTRVSMDALVQSEIEKLTSPPATCALSNWKHQRLQEAPIDALLGFAVFLETAGLRYGYYILPPTPLDGASGRANPAAVFFSSDRQLTHHQEQILFAFTSKMWTETRGLELLSASHSFLNAAYREEIQNKSSERNFFVKTIVFPILCSPDTPVNPSEKIVTQGTSATNLIYNQWAAAQPSAVSVAHLPVLLEYLFSEYEGLSTAELQTISAICHDFRPLSNDGALLITQIRQARAKAQMGGALFSSIADLLKTAEHDLQEYDLIESAAVKCKHVVKSIEDLERGSRSLIKNWCKNSQKSCYLPDNIIYQEKFTAYKARPPFRFPLSDLRAAVAALTDNAERYKSVSYSLQYSETQNDCVVQWLESSPCTWTKPEFLSKLFKSTCDKGIHRGLPRVIIFALESRPKKVEVLTGDYWWTLWPLGEEVTKNEITDFNYGLRFSF